MPDPLPESNSTQPVRQSGLPTPWGYLGRLRDARFERQQGELRSYLEATTPVALLAQRFYGEWREKVEGATPIQDCQKAANFAATYWWQITERLRGFEQIPPPKVAKRYHKLLLEALRSASYGAEITKNGFRFNKFSEVSRGMGYLDEYLEMMSQAEAELGRLLRKYRLIDE